MTVRIAAFDWDDSNRAKCEKHGLTIDEIEAIFESDVCVSPDVKHSAAEDRLIAIGRTRLGRPAFVAFTMRSKGTGHLIRPVSARYMHAKEAAAYEKANKEKSAASDQRPSG